jgi:hypothetical protein
MMTMVKLMRITLNQNHRNIFRNRLCVGLPPLDHLVGQVGVTNEFVLTGERARLPCPLELLPLEDLPQSRTYQPAQFRVVLDDQDMPAPRFDGRRFARLLMFDSLAPGSSHNNQF